MKKRILLFTALLLIASCLLLFPTYGEVDKTSVVTRIVDGDTFDISTGERIRLADVDAPEYYESGYSEATSYLSNLINGKTVYLDVDDVYTYDYSGTGSRLVCVAYVEHNATHLLNVNKALLDGDYAVISNFENEFNPYLWSLYSLNPIAEPTPTPSPTATPKASPTPSPTPIPSLTPLPTASTVPILIPRLLYAGIATLIALAVIVFLYFYVKRNK